MSESLDDRVRKVVADTLGLEIDQIGPETSHEDVENWDSLQVVHLTMALEAEFSVSFSPEEAITFFSVENILAGLKKKDPS